MPARSLLVLIVLAVAALRGEASAATTAPPMLDITHGCNAMAHGSSTAMSECVVAESEARADLLVHWQKLPNAAVERCVKLGRKAKRQPYVAMQKCLSPDIAATTTSPAPADGAKP